MRLFTEDTELAFDSKAKFLDQQGGRDLVRQVTEYRGYKLEKFVMNKVRKLHEAWQPWDRRMTSPFQIRAGYERVMGIVFRQVREASSEELMTRIRKEREDDESKENRRRMFVDRVEMSRKKPRCWRDTEAEEEEDPGSHVAGSAARVAADEEQSPPLQRKQCSLCRI